MNELEKLGLKYRTDKGTKHNYLSVYYNLFKDRRDLVKKVLEIGVAEGASLRMWKEFFPNAVICGVDNDLVRVVKLLKEGFPVFEFDQSKIEDLENLMRLIDKDFDLVIDDGSHNPEDQILTCLTLMPLLKKGVTYVIEDVANPDIVEQLQEFDYEILKNGNRYDNCLIIVRHKNV